MGLKAYTVTLDEDVVNRAMRIALRYGGKLSPLINRHLESWCDVEEGIIKQRDGERD